MQTDNLVPIYINRRLLATWQSVYTVHHAVLSDRHTSEVARHHASVIFTLIYFLVLVLVFQLFLKL